MPLRGPAGDVAAAPTAFAAQYYRLVVDTAAPGDWGGTNGAIYVRLRGTKRTIYLNNLNSPGDSFEQGDRDTFYFSVDQVNNPLGALQDVTVWIRSGAQNRIDNWTYSMTVDTWNGVWVNVGSTGFVNSFARDYGPDRDWLSNPHPVLAACHYDASEGVLYSPCISNSGTIFPFELCQ